MSFRGSDAYSFSFAAAMFKGSSGFDATCERVKSYFYEALAINFVMWFPKQEGTLSNCDTRDVSTTFVKDVTLSKNHSSSQSSINQRHNLNRLGRSFLAFAHHKLKIAPKQETSDCCFSKLATIVEDRIMVLDILLDRA